MELLRLSLEDWGAGRNSSKSTKERNGPSTGKGPLDKFRKKYDETFKTAQEALTWYLA